MTSKTLDQICDEDCHYSPVYPTGQPARFFDESQLAETGRKISRATLAWMSLVYRKVWSRPMRQKVIEFARAAPDMALLRLNRLTGLSFSSWPESLVNPSPDGVGLSRDETEEGSSASAIGLDEQPEKR